MSDDDGVEVRRIHFLTEVADYGAAYECLKCGHLAATKMEMYEHRKGLLSHCFRVRVKALVSGLLG